MSTSTSNDPRLGAPVITVEFVRNLRLSIAEDERLIATITESLPAKKKRLEAAMMFVTSTEQRRLIECDDLPATPEEQVALPVTEEAEDDDCFELEPGGQRATYVRAIVGILDNARGLSHREIMDEILASDDLGPKLAASTKTYYNSITRLESRSEIVRHKGLFYSAKVFRALEASGYAFPDGEIGPRKSEVATQIEQILAQHQPMTAQAVREELLKVAGMPRSLTEHKHYIYNALAPLIGQGVVKKFGELYALSDWQEANK